MRWHLIEERIKEFNNNNNRSNFHKITVDATECIVYDSFGQYFIY